MKTTILGSCVTRDIFRVVGREEENLTYYARTSLVSIFSKPLIIDEEDIKLSSSFQRRMVFSDFNKDFLKHIEINKPDRLIIDFIDERYDLMKYENNYVTKSKEFDDGQLADIYNFELVARKDSNTKILWERGCLRLIEVIRSIGLKEVYIHEAYWASEYINQNGKVEQFSFQSAINENNNLLKGYYDFFKCHMPEVKTLSTQCLADSCHKWGLSAYHYTDSYYHKIYDQLNVFRIKGENDMLQGENIFFGSCNIKYLFKESQSESKYLLVVFSGFPSIGNPPGYNHVRTLEDIDCHKLFILDNHNHTHSSGATYYLGINGDHSVEMSVVALITKIANENNILHNNIICVGSSKGGFASLYFGIKYGLGHVVSGGPQTRLGEYLAHQPSETKYIISFITGNFDAGKEYLNRLLFDLLGSVKRFPKLYIHVGHGDHHYKGHVIPFINKLEELGVSYELDVGDYEKHSQLGDFFPEFLKSRVMKILHND
nr:DUF6270 domain-containing protein [Aneurinibacillus sp. XH2]